MKGAHREKKDVWDQIHRCHGRARTYTKMRDRLTTSAMKIAFRGICRERASLKVTSVGYEAGGNETFKFRLQFTHILVSMDTCAKLVR
jgi:hypothetical protein